MICTLGYGASVISGLHCEVRMDAAICTEYACLYISFAAAGRFIVSCFPFSRMFKQCWFRSDGPAELRYIMYFFLLEVVLLERRAHPSWKQGVEPSTAPLDYWTEVFQREIHIPSDTVLLPT